MSENIEHSVLWNNYFQAIAISIDETKSKKEIHLFKETLNVLEAKVESFQRDDFGIPSNDDFSSKTINRPILSILLSYAKIFVKVFLKENLDFLNSDFALKYIYKYFPKTFSTIYKSEVLNHPLKKEIIAMVIANKIINSQGSTFIHDAIKLGNDKFLSKIKSFLLINELYSANNIRFEIYRQDYKIKAKKQYELLMSLESMINFSIEWILEHGEFKVALKERITEYKKSLYDFVSNIDSKYINSEIVKDNDMLNRFFSLQDYIQMALIIINVKEDTHQNFLNVANIFFTATIDLDTFYITDKIKSIEPDSEWEDRLKEELEKDVFETIFLIIEKIMNFKRANESIEDAYKIFVKLNSKAYQNYLNDLKELKNQNGNIFTPLTVVINSLKRIVIDAK